MFRVVRNYLMISVFILGKSMMQPDKSEDKKTQYTQNAKISGGNEVSISEAPYIVSITNNSNYICSGTIITEWTILTSAHCVEAFSIEGMKVYTGSSNAASGHERYVAGKDLHPKYHNSNLDYDIAILGVNYPLEFSYKCQPVGLPKPFETLWPGRDAYVFGFGSKRYGQKPKSYQPLMMARVPINSHDECKKDYRKYEVTDNMICAGYRNGGMDACMGDSGGPLMLDDTDYGNGIVGIQVGVVSWGLGCGDADKPGVYASVIKALDFIHKITGRKI